MQNAFFTFLLIVFCFGALNADHGWSYQSQNWGGTCDIGYKQSPINLNSYQSDRAIYNDLRLRNYGKVQRNLKMVNNGHTLMIDGFNNRLTLRGGSLQHEYVLEQFHMHWEAEHTLDDTRHPLELHFVHRNTIYPDFATALEYENGVVVIGALYHRSYIDNNDLGYFTKRLRAVRDYSKIGKPVRLARHIVLDNLVPSLSNYFSYSGSLTTPSCKEVVTWIVPTRTYPVSQRQINKFKKIEYKQGVKLRRNYRQLQRTGNRKVYLVSEDSGQARLSVSISLILIFVLVNQKSLL